MIAVLLLTTLNVAICWRLFKTEYTDHFGSIEGAFISIARYLSTHWTDHAWWPLWHCGMPFQDTYVPLLHAVVAAVATVAKISAACAYHIVTGAAYALGPVTLYLMAVRLGAHRGAAFAGALFYSLFSPSALLMPEMAHDLGGLWYGRRLQVLMVYGEGPHVAAMTLLPFAIMALPGIRFAAIAIALVFLTNVPGTMALGLAIFCWLSAQPAGSRRGAWIAAASAAVLAYGLASYFVPPSSVRVMIGNVGGSEIGFANSLRYGPVPLAAVLVAVAAAGWLLARTRLTLATRFAILNFGLVATLCIKAREATFELLPQAGRLHLEMEMGASLLLGAIAWWLYSGIPRRARPVVLALCLMPIAIQFHNYRWRARIDISRADLSKHSEYTTARWLDTHMNGQRVYVAGSTSFWLNAFTDTPQMVGCCDQGESMPLLTRIAWLVNNSPQTDEAIRWLQKFGVRALVVNGPESTDVYKDIHAPERFAGLRVLHRENGDTIYEVPSVGQASGPAQHWPGGLRHIPIAYFPGWKAWRGAERVPVSRDSDGLIQIECNANCDDVALQWTGRPDFRFAAGASVLSLLLLATLLFI
jgi:hypothetical protein